MTGNPFRNNCEVTTVCLEKAFHSAFSFVSFSAAVAEMLVQSTVKDLYLLPALPHDKWASGCVKGLKARGGVTFNICWNEGSLQEVGLWSKEQNSLRLHYRETTVTANISTGRVYTFNKNLKCVKTYSLWEKNLWYSPKVSCILRGVLFL